MSRGISCGQGRGLLPVYRDESDGYPAQEPGTRPFPAARREARKQHQETSMRLASDINPAAPLANPILGESETTAQERYADYKIIRRNGSVVGFEPDKI